MTDRQDMIEVAFHDNVIPQQEVRKTYARLKDQYADDLRERWLDKTEPANHVFQDLTIAAFLIELWRHMYGVVPASETTPETQSLTQFSGFVDIACGNGVVVYVLLMEGYSGWGLDARRRETWGIFPESVQQLLLEKMFIPKPFLDAIDTEKTGMAVHTGDFPSGTFVISNHADELTVWTPLMAALACPASPLPFLAIPCCSHSLSGSSYRYPPPEVKLKGQRANEGPGNRHAGAQDQNTQPASGDLRALRAAKQKEKTADGMMFSMYGSLTAKTMQIAEQVGYHVKKTTLEIPSTRNMAIVGARQPIAQGRLQQGNPNPASVENEASNNNIAELLATIEGIVHRECTRDGGIEIAAQAWVQRAQSLHNGQMMNNPAHQ